MIPEDEKDLAEINSILKGLTGDDRYDQVGIESLKGRIDDLARWLQGQGEPLPPTNEKWAHFVARHEWPWTDPGDAKTEMFPT